MHNSSRSQPRWHVLSSSRIVCRNWHQTSGFAVWLPGFRRAGPSTPLDKSVCRFNYSRTIGFSWANVKCHVLAGEDCLAVKGREPHVDEQGGCRSKRQRDIQQALAVL